MAKKFGFGIVGCGMIANFHAMAIEHIKGAKIVACFDNFGAAAERFAAANKCKKYDKLEDMLKDPAVDVVTICTPSGAHGGPAVAACNAGKHVVVEKPLEITLAKCDAIINAAAKNKVRICSIMPSRFSPANIALKEAIDSGRFGKLTLGDTYVKWWRTQQYYDQGGWRGTWALDGGGAFMNQAIHNVDLLYWFMGEVADVNGVTALLAHERIEVEDVAAACVKFKSGAIGVLEATTAAYPGLLKRTEIHGSAGSVIVEQDNIKMWEFEKKLAKDAKLLEKLSGNAGTGGASDPKAISYTGHMLQLKDFLKAIETGGQPLVDGIEGRKSVEIILAIYQSAWTGKAVKLPLAKDPKRPSESIAKTR